MEPESAGVPPVFLRLLLAGALEPTEYADLLVQYREVYAALGLVSEQCISDDPLVVSLVAGCRARLMDLEADLAVLLGPRWPQAEVLPAARAYRNRALVAAANPEGLIAHHLVRYAADWLGAGQIFLAVSDAFGPLADRLRFHAPALGLVQCPVNSGAGIAALTTVPWGRERTEQVVAEAAAASACDRALLDALGAALGRR